MDSTVERNYVEIIPMPEGMSSERGECPDCKVGYLTSTMTYTMGRGYLVTWDCPECGWRYIL